MNDHRPLGLFVPLSDIDRAAQIAPEMPARQFAEMMRWIAELQPTAVTLPPLSDDDCARIEAMLAAPAPAPIIHSPAPSLPPDDTPELAKLDAAIFEPVEPQPAAAPQPTAQVKPAALSYTEKTQAKIKAAPAEWSVSEIRSALEMLNKGWTAAAIAKALDRPRPGTQFMIGKLRKGWRPKGWDQHVKAAPAPAAPSVQPAAVASPAALAVTPLPTVAPAPMPSQSLTGAQRELMERVKRLDDDFTPQDDLYLAEAVIGRTPLDVIGDQLGCDIATVRARWVDLIGFDPKVTKGGVPLQLQTDLVTVLRMIAGQVAA